MFTNPENHSYPTIYPSQIFVILFRFQTCYTSLTIRGNVILYNEYFPKWYENRQSDNGV